jgi:hypothetical protein
MITLFFISLIGLAVFFASLPVVMFSLMLETAAERGARPVKAERSVVSIVPKRFELELPAAA